MYVMRRSPVALVVRSQLSSGLVVGYVSTESTASSTILLNSF
ncbi:hypothetical protein [Komarekiella delphini-convector]|nr:hypothetical protein [Komarekiella delphini-convector]